MTNPKPDKDKDKSKKDFPKYESKPRIDKPNTPNGHSDKIRQTDQNL